VRIKYEYQKLISNWIDCASASLRETYRLCVRLIFVFRIWHEMLELAVAMPHIRRYLEFSHFDGE
jgi:hypothetical protein